MGLPFYIILYQPRKRPDCSDEQPRRFNLIKKIYYHNDPFLFADYFEFIKQQGTSSCSLETIAQLT